MAAGCCLSFSVTVCHHGKYSTTFSRKNKLLLQNVDVCIGTGQVAMGWWCPPLPASWSPPPKIARANGAVTNRSSKEQVLLHDPPSVVACLDCTR